MTIMALNNHRAAPVRATTAAASESTDRYVPAEEGTISAAQPDAAERMAAGRVLSQAGLADVQCLVTWMAAAAPDGLSLPEFARKALSGVRAITPNVSEGVSELIRLGETCRRAELQTSPETCLEQGLQALALVYGPLERDPARCGEFRGLLGVLGDPQTTYQLLHDPQMATLEKSEREALLHQVVRGLRELHQGGEAIEREDVLKLRDETLTALEAR